MKIEFSGTSMVMTKPWTPEEIFISECLGFENKGNDQIWCDCRKTAKHAVDMFLKHCFPNVFLSENMITYRKYVYGELKVIYANILKYFNEHYYPKLGYPKDLYKHQKESLSTMMYRRYNLLSLEQGLGKTITSASLSKIYGIPRTIVVCPSLVKWNWFRDLTDDWGYDSLYFSILDAKKSKTMLAFKERFVICNYEMIDKHFKHLVKDESLHIIADECHYVKNHLSGRHKGLANLIREHKNARVSLLSGTPVTNRVNDLFAYLKLTGHPLGKNHSAFLKSYTLTKSGRGGNRVIGAKNVDELKLRVSNFIIRKKTEECLDLPDLMIRNYYMGIEDYQEEYDKAMEEVMNNSNTMGNLQANLHTLNRVTAMAKVNQIIQLIDSLWENGRKCIVFSSYTAPLDMLLEHYKGKAVKIDGSVDSHKRDQLINEFKTREDCHVFLGNVKAAGVGINLVNCNDVIFTNFPFTPDDLEQPYKRAHRIGQKNKVNVYYTICAESIDEHIYSLIVDKTKDINHLIDDNKRGVVHYEQIQNMLFKKLVKDYKKKKNLPIEPEDSLISMK